MKKECCQRLAKNDYSDTVYLTGMRAYAILGIFLVHSGGGLIHPPEFLKEIISFGRYGVIAFFMLSAFTICRSIDHTTTFSFKNYLIRRFFRIAPLFYLVSIVCYILGGVGVSFYLDLFKVQVDVKNLIYHLSFMNLFNVRYQNSLIGVEWIIPITVFYYIAMPFAFFYLKKANTLIILIILMASLILPAVSYKLFAQYYYTINKGLSFHWSVEKYAFTYMLGILSYLLFKKRKVPAFTSLHLTIMIIILFGFISLRVRYPDLFLSVWMSIVILMSASRNSLVKILFENPIILWLGRISYSIYLIHFPVLQIMSEELSGPIHIISSFIITVAISSLTYALVEQPFLKLSGRLYDREGY